MKLVNYSRQLAIELKEGDPFFLILESDQELRDLVDELLISVREDTEDWILSDEEEIENKSSRMEMVFSHG